jgi:hypothetical protein
MRAYRVAGNLRSGSGFFAPGALFVRLSRTLLFKDRKIPLQQQFHLLAQ